MRKIIIVVSCMMLLLFATALPVFADDGDLLGSGATAPENGEAAAAPVESSAGASDTSEVPGEDVLAATGLDSGATLWAGLGLMIAGGAVLAVSRRRVKQ